MTTMRAVDVKNGAGPVSALFINPDVPKPKPSPTQCIVHIKAFGLNRADTLQREGKYPVPKGVTHIMGLEFSGVIDEVGDGEGGDARHTWKKGDEVFGLAYGGAYAEYVAVSKRMLVRKPKELSWENTGGVSEVWFTAMQALHVVGGFDPQRTRSILWHAGASSVSIAGIQLSRAANKHHATTSKSVTSDRVGGGAAGSAADLPPPKVFATARQDAKVDFCVKTLGCSGAVNTSTAPDGNWAEQIKKLNGGEGVDLVIDYVGATYFQQNLDVVALDGRIVQLGLMGGSVLPSSADKDGKVDISAFLRKRARFEGSTLRSRDEDYQGHLRDLFEELVLPGLLDGTLENHIDKVLPWEKIQEAHTLLEENKTQGKVICVVDW